MNEFEEVEVPERGYAMIDGHRLPVIDVHLCSGHIALQVLIPADFPGCTDASITLFGHDDRGILQWPSDVTIPPMPPGTSFAAMDLVLGGVS